MFDEDWMQSYNNHFGQKDVLVWEQTKKRLAVGDDVTGFVVARAPFGAWLDISEPFPALLEIIEIDGLDPEDYKAGNWMPKGTEVSAKIVGFDDRNNQIRLSQKLIDRF